jgi:dolichyl-phosphate beta-glucosyltransferase
MKLSVVIPAYNEEKRIPKTLLEISGYLSKQDYDYEIIVVSDGSKDKTAEAVYNLKQQVPNLKLMDNKENHGKGFVVRQGLSEAKGDFRLFTDADNSTSVDQIEKMWPEFEKGYDVVIGSRDIKGAVLNPPQPWLRQILLGEGFKIFRKLVIGLWGIQDTQCGFKFFNKKVCGEVLQKCRIDRFAFDPEILVLAQKSGYKIKEVPVYWKNDLDSKVKANSVFKMAMDLFRIKWNLISKKYAK